MPLARWLPLLFVTACGDTGLPEVIVRDSAGVRIVEHPSDFAAPSWLISETPTIDIGSGDGDSSTLLYQVEGTHRLSDGRIVVANRSSHELRYYDAEGNYLHSAGRQGEGPGEFEGLFPATVV